MYNEGLICEVEDIPTVASWLDDWGSSAEKWLYELITSISQLTMMIQSLRRLNVLYTDSSIVAKSKAIINYYKMNKKYN